ncbi:MAG: NAD(P)H-dependent oxidoreductase [Spirochaetaceae bacterium]
MSQPVEAVVVLAHPKRGSFNHALADTVRDGLDDAGITVHFHDLYAENFDPVLTVDEFHRKLTFDPIVQRFSREVESARLLVFLHPDWWGQPPAILKGWVDRVFRPGVAYEYEGEEFGSKEKIGLLANRRALTVITSDAPPTELETVVHLWRRHIFAFCGIEEEEVLVMPRLRESTHRQRREFLDRVRREALRLSGIQERT